MSRYLYFCKKLHAATERNLIREFLIGAAVSAVLCGMFCFSAPVAFLVLIGYFCLYQMTCMFENDLFLGKKDLDLFCFESRLDYSVIYIAARMIMDTLLSNLMVFFSVGIMLLIQQRFAACLFWCVCWLMNLLLSPCSNLAGENLGKSAGMLMSVLLMLLFLLLVLLYVNNAAGVRALLNGASYPGILLAVLISGAIGGCMLLCSGLKLRQRSGGKRSLLMRALKAWDVLVFKDLLLTGPKLIMPVIMSLTFIWILCKGIHPETDAMFILVCLSHDWFAVKLRRVYQLTANDTVFDERIFPEDRTLLRRARTRTVLTAVPVKLLLTVIASLILHVFSVHLLICGLLLFTGNALAEHRRIYRQDFLTVLMNGVIKYSAVLLIGISMYMPQYHLTVYAYLTAGLLMNLYLNRKLCSGADGEEL